MKNALYIVFFLLGGFLIYKLFSRLGGSSGQPGYSPGGGSGSPGGIFSLAPARQTAVAPVRTVGNEDNTAQIIGASAGALKTVAGIIPDIAKFFTPKPAAPVGYSSPLANLDLIESGGGFQFSQGTTPAVDYTPPDTSFGTTDGYTLIA